MEVSRSKRDAQGHNACKNTAFSGLEGRVGATATQILGTISTISSDTMEVFN
jgi:hypothetical protein